MDCSIGLAAESSYGVGVTPTKFAEFTGESLDWNPTFIQSKGLRVGSRVSRASRRALGKQQAGGDIELEVPSKGFGVYLLAALGAVVTTQRGATGVYQQNHTLATTDPVSSFTIQKGIPPLGGGALLAHTFRGCVLDELEIEFGNSDFVTAKTSWNAKDVDTATAYAPPSYPLAVENFVFAGGAITIGGTVTPPTTTTLATGGTAVANILDGSVKLTNNIDDGGFVLGAGGKRGRRPAVGMAAIGGKLTAEFDTVALRDAYLNQQHPALVLTFLGTTTIGTGTDKPALQITVPDFVLEGELPKTNDGDVITQSIDWTGMDNTALTPITFSYVSTDTAP